MFAVACVIVFVLIAITLQLSKNSTIAMKMVQHTYEVLSNVEQAKSDTYLIELNTQSYRVTGDEKHITDRDKRIQSREESLHFIKQATIDNPRQQLLWHQLREVIDQRLVISSRMILLMKTQGREAATAYIAATQLQETRDRMYKLLLDMEQEERQLLNLRLVKQEHSRELTLRSGVVVGTALVILLIFSFLLIRRQLKEIYLSRKKLAESENKLSTTLHSIGDAVLATDTEGRITHMNSVSEKLTGWQFSEAKGHPIEDVFNIINESTGQPALIPIAKAIKTRKIQNLEDHTILIGRNGNMYPIADSAAPIIDLSGNLSGVVLVFRDVTLERQAEKLIQEQNDQLEKIIQERTFELHTSEEKLRSLTDNVPALIAYVDASERYIYANQKYLDRFAPEYKSIEGLTVSEVLGNDRYAIAAPNIVQALLGKSLSYDWQPFPNVWQMVSYVPTVDVYGYYVLISDITDRKLAELALHKITHFDALTGLPNETQFTQLLIEAIESSMTLDQSFSLLQINIEKLSEINDALGFGRGDQVLKEFAKRLKFVIKDSDCIARLRGDEFAVLLKNSSPAETVNLANQLENVLVQPIVISNIPLDISAKIGIAIFPEHGLTTHDLYRHVDLAVRLAKKKGARYFVFDHNQDSDKPHRSALAAELRHAIDHTEFELYLQPKVAFDTGQVCSVEGLIRWNHSERGLIPPYEFIPLAEQIGLIKPLTQWVISTAVQLIHDWEHNGFIMPIAINLSARNLHEIDLVERIHQLKTRWSIGTGLLEIEVTESSIMDDAQQALKVLQLIREEGIDLSIDDFGTGYSSLSYLQRLPIQFLKIDQSFVSAMLTSKESLMIVKSTIDLAHDLGKKVVAEGVETQAQWNKLTELGCDIAQGYFIAKPMPVDVFLNWIKGFKLTGTSTQS